MTDREKVIKCLEACTGDSDDCAGHTCPYWDFEGDIGCRTQMELDALAMLKEQDAVKPKTKTRHGEYPQIVHRCGNCNEILYRHYKHCPACGRSVKWE